MVEVDLLFIYKNNCMITYITVISSKKCYEQISSKSTAINAFILMLIVDDVRKDIHYAGDNERSRHSSAS